MKNVVLIFVVLMLCGSAFAQNNKLVTVDGLYQQALQLYAEENFKDCVARLERTAKISPKGNAKILYLKTKALFQLCQFDKEYYELFEKTFTIFMEVAPKQNYLPSKIQEIENLRPQLQIITTAKTQKAQRLAVVRDSLKADSTKQATISNIYNKALQLYEENKLKECFTFLADTDTLLSEPDVKILYLKVKTLYPLFPKSSSYQVAIKEVFAQFNNRVQIQDFPLDRKQEILDLQHKYNEKIAQIEAERVRRAEIARMYQVAEQLYEDDKLADCITQTEQLEIFIGAPTAKTLYLKIKALHPLKQETDQYKFALEQALPQFFQVAEVQNCPPQKVAEIKQIREISYNTQQKAIEESKFFSGKITFETRSQSGMTPSSRFEHFFYKNFSKMVYTKVNNTKMSDTRMIITKGDKSYSIKWNNTAEVSTVRFPTTSVKPVITKIDTKIDIVGKKCSAIQVEASFGDKNAQTLSKYEIFYDPNLRVQEINQNPIFGELLNGAIQLKSILTVKFGDTNTYYSETTAISIETMILTESDFELPAGLVLIEK